MSNILIITPRFPYPVIGGDRLRIYEICKELSKTHTLTLVSLCETKEEMEYEVDVDGVFSSIHRCYHPKWKSYLNTFFSLFTQTPLQVAYYNSKEFKVLIDSMIESNDLVIPHLVRVVEYIKDVDIPKIFEMTDAISLNYARVCDTKNNAGIKGAIYKLERRRLNQYEKRLAEYFDYNILVSQIDKDFLFKKDTEVYNRTLICSNGVDLSSLPYEFSPSKKEVVFIGNMFSAQNFDAAMWFAKECLPVLRKYGEYTFKVIGRIKPEGEQKLKRIEGVVVTGAVENIVSHARGAIAGVCSVRLAAGVQNKILEYMALGLPSITTSTGLEGLDSIPGQDILLANTPDEFTKQILRLNNDREFAQLLSINAFKYVQKNHSWSGKLAPVTIAINNLLSN